MQNNGFAPYMFELFAHPAESPTAFRIYDGVQVSEISYDKLADDILASAGFFKAHGIFHKHIAILSPNCYDWVVTFFGIISSGNIAVPLNPDLPAEDIADFCRRADVDIIIKNGTEEGGSMLSAYESFSFSETKNAAAIDREDVYSAEKDETLLLLPTSGTTGKSKIIELTSGNMIASLISTSAAEPERPTDIMPFFPFFHAGGILAMNLLLGTGKTFLLGRGPKYIFADIAHLQPGVICSVPLITDTLVKAASKAKDRAGLSKYCGSRLSFILCAGSKMTKATCDIMQSFGIRMYAGYGMSESCTNGSYSSGLDHFDSIGHPNPGVEFKIAEGGELLIRSDSVMKGYYKEPEETAAVLADGWLHTGDLASCDEDGFYYIIGRKKNVICLANGENVNPEEIEELLTGISCIEECLVYSDGKGICADVYCEDKDLAEKEIHSYNDSVPKYRQIYKIYFSDAPLEKTGSGKIKRKENK